MAKHQTWDRQVSSSLLFLFPFNIIQVFFDFVPMISKLKEFFKFISPKYQSLHLEYKVDPKPRYGHGQPAHPGLLKVIEQGRDAYAITLNSFLPHVSAIQQIKPERSSEKSVDPHWNNGYLPGLDIIALYSLVANFRPARYVEIGSGNSTMVVAKAIRERQLQIEITSIDPYPRALIDGLSTNVIRQPLESLKNYDFITDSLQKNDILFIDNSHRVFPNSDAMVCFLDLIPKLKKGVIVHIHDIYLPYDYPQFLCDRFYNEQYVLAAYLIANPEKFRTILPNYFISEDPSLSSILSPFWQHENMKNVEKHGGSFWFQIG